MLPDREAFVRMQFAYGTCACLCAASVAKRKSWRGFQTEIGWNGKLGEDFAKQLTPYMLAANSRIAQGNHLKIDVQFNDATPGLPFRMTPCYNTVYAYSYQAECTVPHRRQYGR